MNGQDIKQSEFAERHGLKPAEVAALRRGYLTEDDWRREGRTIWWSAAGSQKAEAALRVSAERAAEMPDAEPLPSPVLYALVLSVARNPRFVYAKAGWTGGQRLAVRVRPGDGPRLVGKRIRLRADEQDGCTQYHHER